MDRLNFVCINPDIVVILSDFMLVEKLPGIENEQQRDELINRLLDGAYWARRLGKNKASDLFENTAKSLTKIRFKSSDS